MLVTEYVVWGVAPDQTDECVLVSKMPTCFGKGDGPIVDSCIAHDISEACTRRGATKVRVQRVDIDDPFAGWLPPR